MKDKLIIGKNSWVVGNLKATLKDFDFISHSDIGSLNLNKYKWIFLFSWSNVSLEDNLKIVESIPKKKLIFVSTLAVHSITVRTQWNQYVLNKKIVEDYLLKNNNSSILRLGIFTNLKEDHYGLIPYTSFSKLASLLNNWSANKDRIIECFEIFDTKNKTDKIVDVSNYLSGYFNKILIIRKFIEYFIKHFLNSPRYGYTADLLSLFHESLQIGFGALGQSYYKKNKSSMIVVSNKKDKFLINDGFRNTILGFKNNGLAKYWHGVFLEIKGSDINKKVPFFVNRGKVPLNAIKNHVEKVTFDDNFFKISLENKIHIKYLYAKKLILSCGAIQNIQILSEIFSLKNKFFFSDQEWHIFGKISSAEALKNKFLTKIGPFVTRKKLLLIKNKKYFPALLEFRPMLSSKDNYNINFFNDTSYNIFLRLITKFSLNNMNQAFFNKIGIGLCTRDILIIGQVEAKNSIIIDNLKRYRRIRIPVQEINMIKNLLKNKFNSFKPNNIIVSTDSQHISIESISASNKKIEKLINQKILTVLGTKTLNSIHRFYPTKEYINLLNKE